MTQPPKKGGKKPGTRGFNASQARKKRMKLQSKKRLRKGPIYG